MSTSSSEPDTRRPSGGEKETWPYRVLSRSSAYGACNAFVGADRVYERFVADHVRPFPGARVLDVGCGTGTIAKYLGDVEYVGIEPNDDYVTRAERTLGGNCRVLQGGIESVAEQPAQAYDLILFVGVLHHLSDELISRHLREVAARLAPGGRLVALETTLFAGQPLLARTFARLDRGTYVRSPGAYSELLRIELSDVRTFLRGDLLRFPYVHCVIEASASPQVL